MGKLEIVEEYIKRYGKDYPNRSLAAIMVSENPEMFENIESARCRIRYLKGTIGDKLRKNRGYEAGDLSNAKTIEESLSFLKELKEEIPDFVIDNVKRTLVISDLHIPYHDNHAVSIAIEAGRKFDVDSVIINGDLLDFYQISRWSKDPNRKNITYEIAQGQEFFMFLRAAFPGAEIFFKLGNHEDRYEQYLKQNAPALFGDPYFELEKRLDCDNLGVQMVKSRQKIKYGHLNILHGHEFGQSFFNPVNPARGLFLRAKASTLAGHNHQTSEHYEGDINEKLIGCYSTGCLCDLKPEYRPFAYTKWNHGYALLEQDGKEFEVTNKRIL